MVKSDDLKRVFAAGAAADSVAVTTCNDEEVKRRYLYSFTPESLERYTRDIRNTGLDKAIAYLEASGSRSRGWLIEGIEALKEKE